MPDLLLAHAGHWLVNLLYLMPVIAVLVAIAISYRKAKEIEADGKPIDGSGRDGNGQGG